MLDINKIRKHLERKIVAKSQQLGSSMMSLSDKMNKGEIWNTSQVFLGQTLALDTGDLYILNSCLTVANSIKHAPTKQVFLDVLHLWALTVVRNDEGVSEQQHPIIEAMILELSEKLSPEILGLLEAVSTDDRVIGSPFADESGKGFEKYMQFVLSRPRKQRAEYWQTVAER